jgi:CheY-like chemotaxis protein
MGERILRDEGFEVATVTDGETALLRLKDLGPDLVLADISLPNRNGYEVCEYVKTSGKYPKTRVVLTAGPVTAFDEARAQSAGSDGFVRKPFEASVLLATVQPLVEARENGTAAVVMAPAAKVTAPAVPTPVVAPPPPAPQPIDREQVRAAVILALEASMITIIENITDKVVVALEAETRPAAAIPSKPAPPEPKPAPVELKTTPVEPKTTTASVAKPAPPPIVVTQAPPAKLPEAKPLETKPPEVKPEPAPAEPPEEPVVRIRTPLFRSLS